MTLSRFLKDYLYIPLGGNRKGKPRRYVNLLLTMILGGLWHGAAWTFVVWGLLHGLYLSINHYWQELRARFNFKVQSKAYVYTARLITLLAVTVTWVYFRADSLTTANRMVESMLGLNGIVWPNPDVSIAFREVMSNFGVSFLTLSYFNGWKDIFTIVVLTAFVWNLPNTQELVLSQSQSQPPARILLFPIHWSPTMFWILFTITIAMVSLLNLTSLSEFLYFQF
jgi:hypothetical protein